MYIDCVQTYTNYFWLKGNKDECSQAFTQISFIELAGGDDSDINFLNHVVGKCLLSNQANRTQLKG